MPILNEEHLVNLNLQIARGNGGVWEENKGHLNIKYVLEIINDMKLSHDVAAAKAALAIVTLQVFRDGNHRTAIMVYYYLMICGRMMPRRNALQIYGKLCQLEDSFRKALGDTEAENNVARNFSIFVGFKVKQWGRKDSLLGHMDRIIPTVAREVDRLPQQLRDIHDIQQQYRPGNGRQIPKTDADLSDTGKVRMYVAYAKALGYKF
jgi:hypothetical protein